MSNLTKVDLCFQSRPKSLKLGSRQNILIPLLEPHLGLEDLLLHGPGGLARPQTGAEGLEGGAGHRELLTVVSLEVASCMIKGKNFINSNDVVWLNWLDRLGCRLT